MPALPVQYITLLPVHLSIQMIALYLCIRSMPQPFRAVSLPCNLSEVEKLKHIRPDGVKEGAGIDDLPQQRSCEHILASTLFEDYKPIYNIYGNRVERTPSCKHFGSFSQGYLAM